MRTDRQMHPELRGSPKWKNNWRGESDAHPFGMSFSGGERDCLFISVDGREFVDLSNVSGADSPSDGRGFAHFDYDRDGFSDLAVVSANEPCLTLLRNRLGDGAARGDRAIAVSLVGGNRTAAASREWSARDGFGARVHVRLGAQTLVRELRCGEGFSAQNSATLLIGIGTRESADVVEVRWPSGKSSRAERVAAGERVRFFENRAESESASEPGVERSHYCTELPPAQLTAIEQTPVPELALTPSSAEGNAFQLYTTMATWCEACRKHLPHLARLRESFPAEQLALFGVPVDPDDTPQMLEKFSAQHRPAYELLDVVDESQRAALDELARRARLPLGAIPISILVGPGGAVLAVEPGVPTISRVRKAIDQFETALAAQ